YISCGTWSLVSKRTCSSRNVRAISLRVVFEKVDVVASKSDFRSIRPVILLRTSNPGKSSSLFEIIVTLEYFLLFAVRIASSSSRITSAVGKNNFLSSMSILFRANEIDGLIEKRQRRKYTIFPIRICQLL